MLPSDICLLGVEETEDLDEVESKLPHNHKLLSRTSGTSRAKLIIDSRIDSALEWGMEGSHERLHKHVAQVTRLWSSCRSQQSRAAV